MKILIIGDIYGEVGRKIVKESIIKVKNYFINNCNSKIDFIIANGENTTHGKSLSFAHYQELKSSGIDVITSGNHIFAPRSDILHYIKSHNDVLRPLNYNPYHPGNGTILVVKNNKKIRVTNLIGRTFMDKADNPYYALEQVLLLEQQNLEVKSDIHIVDFHAEATAEKIALTWYFDGKITCLVGTHTHVQTVDNRLLPEKTAFISDVGMCGPYYSIIGANPDEVIYRDRCQLATTFKPATGKGQFCAVVLTIDDESNMAVKLERIYIRPDNEDVVLY